MNAGHCVEACPGLASEKTPCPKGYASLPSETNICLPAGQSADLLSKMESSELSGAIALSHLYTNLFRAWPLLLIAAPLLSAAIGCAYLRISIAWCLQFGQTVDLDSTRCGQALHRSACIMAFCTACCAAPDKSELDFGSKPLVDAKGVLDKSPDQVVVESGIFEANLRYEGRSHGLVIDTANEEQAIIKDVTGAGLVWNRNAAEHQQIKTAAMILKVNGEAVTGENVHRKLADAGPEATLTLQKAVERNLVLHKPGQLGITVKFAKSSYGIWIATLAPGLVQDWNEKNPDQTVSVNDRIVSVNGVTGQSQDLVAKMREVSDAIVLVVQHYE
ncbi:unnamed protein product [Symbiodinium sp. KB8]|nr:unnamed protein product [Symbiodinium sp. KB8]